MCRWGRPKKHQVQILNLCTFLTLLDEKCCSYRLCVTIATVWWFFSATRNEIQVLESGLVSACTICIWVIRLIVNECSYQYGPRASLKIDSDLHLHVSISGLEGKMVLYFPKYCYMRFESCPFVLKCMCYCLVFETGANAILGNGKTQRATHLNIKHSILNDLVVQCHILDYQIYYRINTLPCLIWFCFHLDFQLHQELWWKQRWARNS